MTKSQENPLFVHVPYLQDNSFYFRANEFSPGTYFPLHIHPELELQYVECGHGRRLIGSVLEDFSEGAVHLVPGNVPHLWCYSKDEVNPSPARSFTIQFKSDFFTEAFGMVPELRREVDFISGLKDAMEIKGKAAVNIAGMLKAMVKQTALERFISFLKILEELSSASEVRHIKVNHIVTSNPRSMTRIQQVFSYMEENHDKNFSLDAAAAHVGMNKASFCKFFKQVTGHTFIDAVNDIRISEATMLLLNYPSMPVSEIAYRVGYDSLSHFNHTFQRLKGVSPSAYRSGRRGIIL